MRRDYVAGDTYRYHGLEGQLVTWTRDEHGLWWANDGRPEFATDADVSYAKSTDSTTGSAPVCDVVTVQGRVLAATCGHPLPCPEHSDA